MVSGGVWWCVVVYGVWWCVVVYGVWWCMVYGVWWCVVVYGGECFDCVCINVVLVMVCQMKCVCVYMTLD